MTLCSVMLTFTIISASGHRTTHTVYLPEDELRAIERQLDQVNAENISATHIDPVQCNKGRKI